MENTRDLIPQTLTTGAAATLLGVSIDTIHRYLDKGLIAGHTLPSGHRRIDADSVLEMKDSRRRLSSTVTVIGGSE